MNRLKRLSHLEQLYKTLQQYRTKDLSKKTKNKKQKTNKKFRLLATAGFLPHTISSFVSEESSAHITLSVQVQ